VRVKVLFFAQIRDALGRRDDTIDLEDGCTVEDAVVLLRKRPEWRTIASLPLRFAVDERVVGGEHVLRNGDRLALLTPVSGG
jgi:molybdopterin synthase sulfur carrier subunit